MMVLMALVTTFMTAPLLEWIYPMRVIRTEISRSSIAAAGHVAGGSAQIAPLSSD
jgi:hypothetical protein